MRRPSTAALATALAVAGAVGIVLWQLDPRLLLADTLMTGGDTGAHVATVAFLRTELLPHLRLTGWDPEWFDGFPLYTFYFPLPDLLAAVGGYLVPPDVAFKVMTALGSLSLPVAAWAFGRLSGLERPRPAVLALATVPFLFDQTFTIDGGNIYSTMAGEYAFSLALSLAVVFLGLCLWGMRTGRGRALAAVVLAACALSHVVPAFFAVVGAIVVLVVSGPTWRRVWWMVSVGVVGGALVAFWAVPFLADLAYTTTMGWVNVHRFLAVLAPGTGVFHGDRWVLWLAMAGAIAGALQRRRPMVVLGVLAALSAAAVVLDPPSKIYNVRFLPLWWLCVYLLAGVFVAETGVVAARGWRSFANRGWRSPLNRAWRSPLVARGWRSPVVARRGRGAMTLPGKTAPERQAPDGVAPAPRRARWAPGAVGVPVACLAAAAMVVLPPLYPTLAADVHVGASSVPSWVSWDYSGYQATPGWAELEGVVRTVDAAAHRYGCGRAMWEYSPSLDRFGTPMALMVLPMLTGGCVDTQGGLLFESSATTPYHFVTQAELSTQPSEAMAGLPYPAHTPDVAVGVEQLQLLGVRYFLASSPQVEAQAGRDPSLTLLASSGPWHTPFAGQIVTTTWKLYLVHGAAPVVALTEQPTVLEGVGPSQSSWLSVALRWYDDPARQSTEMVAGGPSSWPHTSPEVTSPQRRLPGDKVSDVHMGTDSVRFDVSRIGVPVLVKVSYFPNWHASGAKGPWRAEPNLMVVLPTSHHVQLTYGSTPASDAGSAISGAGLLGLGALVVRRNAWSC